MTFVVRDSIQETATIASTTITLLGATNGFQRISSADDSKTLALSLVESGSSNRITFFGSYTESGRTVSVDQILTSSAGGTTMPTWGSGLKILSCGPVEKITVLYDATTGIITTESGDLILQPSGDLLLRKAKFAISGQMESPTDKTYTIDLSAATPYKISSLTHKTSSGTLTAAVQINGTNVTGLSAVSVSSSKTTTTATAANSVSTSDTVTIVVSGSSTPTDFVFNLNCVFGV